ncbi:MFS transporter [uncultured Desulfuromonas sp.]|uniref:MFS transporter n=1 Tax=uncultured Desulfuromonas sp. TaxID=181013 RepID=UPI00260B757F|nr:MFS transporter [uncultured Desulfuromonas sp.]
MSQPPQGAAERPFARRLVALLCFTVFFSVLNGTMFNVAVPDIARQFALSPTEVSWVVTGYIVVFALGSVTFGKLADLYPLKNLITLGLLLFNAGALIGFFASWYPLLLVGRLVQASGGSAIPALSMIVATRFVPPERRGRVMGAVASTVAFAAGVGPIVGGYIGGALHWRYLFLLSTATLLAVPLYRRLLPAEKKGPDGFDLPGALLLGGGVVSLLLFVSELLWWAAPLAVLLLLLLVRHLRRAASPFVHPGLFRDRRYLAGLVAAFLAVGTIFGMMFHVPLLLRAQNGLGTEAIGLVIFPGAMSAAVLGAVAGRLADRRGSVPVVLAGMVILVAGYLLLAACTGSSPALIATVLVVAYSGFAFVHASLAKTVSLVLPPERVGIGMGFYNLTFFMSGSFGAAITAQLLEMLRSLPPVAPWVGPAAAASSNIFLVSAATVLAAALLFRGAFAEWAPKGEKS